MIDYDDFEEEQRRREAEYDSISEYLEKQKNIKKEVNRLKRLFREIDENKKTGVYHNRRCCFHDNYHAGPERKNYKRRNDGHVQKWRKSIRNKAKSGRSTVSADVAETDTGDEDIGKLPASDAKSNAKR